MGRVTITTDRSFTNLYKKISDLETVPTFKDVLTLKKYFMNMAHLWTTALLCAQVSISSC